MPSELAFSRISTGTTGRKEPQEPQCLTKEKEWLVSISGNAKVRKSMSRWRGKYRDGEN